MIRQDKNNLFRIANIGIIAILVIYILLIVFNLILNTDPSTLTGILLSTRVYNVILLSLSTATISSIIALVISIPIAYFLSRHDFKGKNIIDTLLDIPVVVSPVALGMGLVILFSSKYGKLFEEHILNFTYAIPGIILAQFTIIVGLSIRLLKAVFDQINMRLEHVAYFLGASNWQILYKITLPLAKKGIIASFVLVWARAIGEFGCSVTLAGAMPGITETIPTAIYIGLGEVNLNEVLFFTLLLLGIAFVVLFLIRGIFKQNESSNRN